MSDLGTLPVRPGAPFGPGGRFAAWAPSSPRFVALDVDGTLLSRNGCVAAPVTAAVERCHAAGLRLGLTTGRSAAACEGLIADLALPGPHVFHNGAEVRYGGRTRISPLPDRAVTGVREVARAHGVYAELYTSDGFWVSDAREALRPHWATMGAEPAGPAGRCPPADVFKATVVTFPADDVATVIDELRRVGAHVEPSFAHVVPDATFLNVTAPGAHKGSAVMQVAATADLSDRAIVAIGDGPNDVSMFCAVGTAIAMGNAPDAVRGAAHLVAPTLEDHGVARALNRLVTDLLEG